MQILKNKHLILAMFVAPLLAILAYFAVDYAVSEEPHAAQPGESYRLAAMSNCRYQSGLCTLRNGDVEMTLRARHIADSDIELSLDSEFALKNALLSVVYGDADSPPVPMQSPDQHDAAFSAIIRLQDPEQSLLRLVVELSGALYYAETTAIFVDYETAFTRENFSN